MCLVDNPGFGEAKQHVLQLAERSMRCSSAYIYLSETTSLGGTVDARAYRTIADQDRGGRFLCMVYTTGRCYDAEIYAILFLLM